MRDFIYSLMTDRLNGKAYAPYKAALFLSSLVYGAVIFFRKVFYRSGIFRSKRAPLKIVSVGNITIGGTGKTPFVISLARLLKDGLSKEVSVLIRGYGWDEQAMLKSSLTDIPVIVGENRLRSARKAIRLYGSDTAILDDGFQHWELKRDMDIVLVDSRNPFGNGRLFPRGILRETKSALEMADVIVFTKTDNDQSVPDLKKEITDINTRALYVEARHRPRHIYEMKTKKIYGLSYLAGKRIALLSGIGDPDYFRQTVEGFGSEVVEHFVFRDHHDYTSQDIREAAMRCGSLKIDAIVTTEKDAVKLNRFGLSIGGYTMLVMVVEMEITRGKESLIDRLNKLYHR